MTARNERGQFEKGVSGNPRGRPRKVQHQISNDHLRQGFFDAMETLVSIAEGGKRKFIPARIAIDKQLVLKAAGGDMRAISECNKRRDRFTFEYGNEQIARLDALYNGLDRARKFPEDVTDEFKRLLKSLSDSIDPYYRP
jgi:Family of unknown function (DUF5681)